MTTTNGNDIFACVFLYENTDVIVEEIIRIIGDGAKNLVHIIRLTQAYKEKVAKVKSDCRYPCFIIKHPGKDPEITDATIDKARMIVASVSKMLK